MIYSSDFKNIFRYLLTILLVRELLWVHSDEEETQRYLTHLEKNAPLRIVSVLQYFKNEGNKAEEKVEHSYEFTIESSTL